MSAVAPSYCENHSRRLLMVHQHNIINFASLEEKIHLISSLLVQVNETISSLLVADVVLSVSLRAVCWI